MLLESIKTFFGLVINDLSCGIFSNFKILDHWQPIRGNIAFVACSIIINTTFYPTSFSMKLHFLDFILNKYNIFKGLVSMNVITPNLKLYVWFDQTIEQSYIHALENNIDVIKLIVEHPWDDMECLSMHYINNWRCSHHEITCLMVHCDWIWIEMTYNIIYNRCDRA